MEPPQVLWRPSPEQIAASQMASFLETVNASRSGLPPLEGYPALHRWSIENREAFWAMWLHESGMQIGGRTDPVELAAPATLGARFFPNVTLNFAENLLRHRDDRPALVSVSETRQTTTTSYAELHQQVHRLRTSLERMGVGPGDRVAGVLPNISEAVVAMLATTSLGAVWSSCSPDFGTRGVLERFAQIEPKVLFATNGYSYGGKAFSCVEKLEEIAGGLPGLTRVVMIPHGPSASAGPRVKSLSLNWEEALAVEVHGEIVFPRLPFNHPVYILFSSGTTGVPKCIVHGAGGTLLQHSKELMLHTDLGREDNLLFFTTCGWMMWNWMVSALFVGSTVTLFDGSPAHPSQGRLWETVADEGVTHFGTSPKYIGTCRDALSPGREHELARLRVILSTGAPLLPEDFDWVYAEVKQDVLLASISGGTDIVSCFMLGNPLLPVIRGEIQAMGLGMDVAAFNEENEPVVGEQGELVCRSYFPSMPVQFWNDEGGVRYSAAYYREGDTNWYHGDYIAITESQGECGGVLVSGRSDATLNPGGVRIGTAEIYGLVETLPWVADSLVVGQPWEGDVRIVLFVQPVLGVTLDDARQDELRRTIRSQASPRHVPAKIVSVKEIPYTRSGKKVEIAVREIIGGVEPRNKEALNNPEALDEFRDRDELST
jgi:acetoacetyl-CoA synthetase